MCCQYIVLDKSWTDVLCACKCVHHQRRHRKEIKKNGQTKNRKIKERNGKRRNEIKKNENNLLNDDDDSTTVTAIVAAVVAIVAEDDVETWMRAIYRDFDTHFDVSDFLP